MKILKNKTPLNFLVFSTSFLLLTGCTSVYNNNGKPVTALYSDTGKKSSALQNTTTDSTGTLIKTINFLVRTADLKNFPDGLMPWLHLVDAEKEIKNLVGKDSLVLTEQNAILVIDYPLNHPAKFHLVSKMGFTRLQLIQEICKDYRNIYEEEEKTATIKTIPIKERGNTLNRNETNGKYGIWGHDLADLAVDYIEVYRKTSGEIVLMLNMES